MSIDIQIKPKLLRWLSFQSGVAVQFENICKAMNFFKKKENLNEKTNVIGILFGTIDDIIPINSKFSPEIYISWIYLIVLKWTKDPKM